MSPYHSTSNKRVDILLFAKIVIHWNADSRNESLNIRIAKIIQNLADGQKMLLMQLPDLFSGDHRLLGT